MGFLVLVHIETSVTREFGFQNWPSVGWTRIRLGGSVGTKPALRTGDQGWNPGLCEIYLLIIIYELQTASSKNQIFILNFERFSSYFITFIFQLDLMLVN